MTQHLDHLVAGGESRRQLAALIERRECGSGNVHPNVLVEVTILKILTLIAGLFLTLMVATTLDPQLAFISITMIVVCTGAILIASEKIVRIFPRHTSHRDYAPASKPVPRAVYVAPTRSSYFPSWPVWASSSRQERQGPLPSSWAGSSSSSSSSSSFSSARSPIVQGTRGNVSVGGGHDRRDTTPAGNVIPGSGLGSGSSRVSTSSLSTSSSKPPIVQGTQGNVAVGGGHDQRPSGIGRGRGGSSSIAPSTQEPAPPRKPGNVVVGGGHDLRETTPDGRVIPGSGLGR